MIPANLELMAFGDLYFKFADNWHPNFSAATIHLFVGTSSEPVTMGSGDQDVQKKSKLTGYPADFCPI